MSRKPFDIILCTNYEVLNCEPEQVSDFIAAAELIALPECVSLVEESSFKFWNGGPGTGHVSIRINGFGTVASLKAAHKAISWLASTGVNTWPSSDELTAAFDAFDEFLELPLPERATN